MMSKVKQFFKNEWQSLRETLSKVKSSLEINDFSQLNYVGEINK